MPGPLTERLKPAAPARVHLITAARLWSAVGLGLGLSGWRWAHVAPLPARPWLLVAALATGFLKGWIVLRRSARSIVDRIRARGDGKCRGGFLSGKTWFFVLAMMAMGRTLRYWVLPLAWAGLLYLWVGTALLTGSLFIWKALWGGLRATAAPSL